MLTEIREWEKNTDTVNERRKVYVFLLVEESEKKA